MIMNTSLAVGSLLREIGLDDKESLARHDNPDLASFLEDGKKSESWLRTRLFESLVAYDGLNRYLSSLAVHNGANVEKEVKLNGLLAAIHLSSSLNPIIFETIAGLRKNNKIALNDKQLIALAKILKPENFRLRQNEIDVEFDPLVVEDIRLEVQKSIFDKIYSNKVVSEKSPRLQTAASDYDDVPGDLENLGLVGKLDLGNALSLTKRFKDLSISLRNGYVIWKYGGFPTLYIKDGKAYFSLKSGRSVAEAQKQKEMIIRLLNEIRPRLSCSICSSSDVSEAALLDSGVVGMVCSKCEKNQRVVRLLLSTPPSALE